MGSVYISYVQKYLRELLPSSSTKAISSVAKMLIENPWPSGTISVFKYESIIRFQDDVIQVTIYILHRKVVGDAKDKISNFK